MMFVISVLLMVLSSAASSGQGKQEQHVFDAESATLQNPVPVPPNVLKLLSTDRDVKDVAEGRNAPVSKEWFSASVVSTAKPSEKLYLVVGNGPLLGAHVTTFWMVGSRRSGAVPSVLLKVTADRLEIGKPDASGYPKVTAVHLTATSMADIIYRFASGKYIPINPGS